MYRMVIVGVACPSSFCSRTMGTPACAACTAKVWRKSCGVAPWISAARHGAPGTPHGPVVLHRTREQQVAGPSRGMTRGSVVAGNCD
jgi:hypothetical protein